MKEVFELEKEENDLEIKMDTDIVCGKFQKVLSVSISQNTFGISVTLTKEESEGLILFLQSAVKEM